MPDSAVIFGLVGALGGATATALATYFGPMRLHKRAREGAAEEEQRRAKYEHHEAELHRLVAMRTTPRAWLHVLRDFGVDLLWNRPIDLERFDERMASARSDLAAAQDAALFDGRWFNVTSGQGHAATLAQFLGRPDNGIPSVTAALTDATLLMRKLVVAGRSLTDDEKLAMQDSLVAVEMARGALAEYIMGRVAAIIHDRDFL